MRKTIDVTITNGTKETNRDLGKTFHLTEMSARQTERWAARALSAVAKSGVDIPVNIGSSSLQTITMLGLGALLRIDFAEAEPLLDEMMTCVKIKEPAVIRDLTPDDIEEAATLVLLKMEVFKLHTNFWLAGARSTSTSETPAAGSSSTPMSRG